jgi:hypothetical protein
MPAESLSIRSGVAAAAVLRNDHPLREQPEPG